MKEPREPVKENIGRGTGIGTLTPICSKNEKITRHIRNTVQIQIY